MSFHTVAYTVNAGVNAVNTDMTAATDPEISQRNSHYIFTEQYSLLAALGLGANITRASFQAPSWNQYTRFNIWPINRSANMPSNPQLDWWIRYPVPMPQNEEFQVQVSNNLGAGNEQETVFLWLAPQGWSQQLPSGIGALPVFEARLNFTTAALTANAWSGLGSVTFEQSLLGGTYAVVGAQIQGTGLLVARFVFPRAPIYMNRRMRPGIMASQSLGDVPMDFTPYQQFSWGEFGRFSTFEPPQMEYWANAAGAVAVEMRWWLVYLSKSMDVQYAA